jgi:hypothetical protein
MVSNVCIRVCSQICVFLGLGLPLFFSVSCSQIRYLVRNLYKLITEWSVNSIQADLNHLLRNLIILNTGLSSRCDYMDSF